MTDYEKARRYEQMILNAHFEASHWLKFWNDLSDKNTPTGGFAEGMFHSAKNLLWYADRVEGATCPCSVCRNKEKMLLTIREHKQCQNVSEEK